MLRSQQARGKHVVITELHLLAVNNVTRRRRTLRHEAILNECLFEDERLLCVATMFHLPPAASGSSENQSKIGAVANRWTDEQLLSQREMYARRNDALSAVQTEIQEIMNSTSTSKGDSAMQNEIQRHCQR